MSEIKFSCPHCSQHIACDENYGGFQITCPACQNKMIVPHRASPGLEINAVAMPPARKAALYPKPSDTGFWTEAAWQRREAERTQPLGWPIKILMLLPIVLFFLLGPWIFDNSLTGKSASTIAGAVWWTLLLVCSSSAAWLILRRVLENVIVRALVAIPLALGILLAQVSIGFFAGGCGADFSPLGGLK